MRRADLPEKRGTIGIPRLLFVPTDVHVFGTWINMIRFKQQQRQQQQQYLMAEDESSSVPPATESVATEGSI